MRGLSKRDRNELTKQMGAFLQQYQRKAQKGREPNDRHYDHGVEQVIRKLKPEDLDALLNGDEDEHYPSSRP